MKNFYKSKIKPVIVKYSGRVSSLIAMALFCIINVCIYYFNNVKSCTTFLVSTLLILLPYVNAKIITDQLKKSANEHDCIQATDDFNISRISIGLGVLSIFLFLKNFLSFLVVLTPDNELLLNLKNWGPISCTVLTTAILYIGYCKLTKKNNIKQGSDGLRIFMHYRKISWLLLSLAFIFLVFAIGTFGVVASYPTNDLDYMYMFPCAYIFMTVVSFGGGIKFLHMN